MLDPVKECETDGLIMIQIPFKFLWPHSGDVTEYILLNVRDALWKILATVTQAFPPTKLIQGEKFKFKTIFSDECWQRAPTLLAAPAALVVCIQQRKPTFLSDPGLLVRSMCLVSLSDSDLTDVTLADKETNLILTDKLIG